MAHRGNRYKYLLLSKMTFSSRNARIDVPFDESVQNRAKCSGFVDIVVSQISLTSLLVAALGDL